MKLHEVASGLDRLYLAAGLELLAAVKDVKDPGIKVSWVPPEDSLYNLPTIDVSINSIYVKALAEKVERIVKATIPPNGIQPYHFKVHTIVDMGKRAMYHITVGPR